MISFFKKLKTNKLKTKSHKLNRGMTYVELIVVLSIFSVLSSVAIYNYGDFRTKIDMKNLTSDIALKIVEAQKSSVSGLLPLRSYPSNWKPSYGVQFDLTMLDNKSFIYFTDLDNSTTFDGTNCTDECLNEVSISNGNFISNIDVFYKGKDPTVFKLNNLVITFTRPNSGALIKADKNEIDPTLVDHAQIVISSPQGVISSIEIYPSGRIQIN